MESMQSPVAVSMLVQRLLQYPPTLTIRDYSHLVSKQLPTIRQQIRRGVFPIAVHQMNGGEQYILSSDCLKFWMDGKRQEQPQKQLRAGRNPAGRNGKRGRPSHQERGLSGGVAK